MRRDLPDQIALFPIAGALLLPRARLPLQVFEPRYMQMLDDVLKTGHRLIGVIQPVGDDDLAPVGCAGRLTGFSESDDGRYMIELRGLSRFTLTGATEGFAPYLTGTPDWAPWAADRKGAETDPGLDRDAFLDRLGRFMAMHDLATDMDSARAAEAEMLINALAMMLPFEPEEKQALLEAPTLRDRRRMLDGLIGFALHSTGEDRLQ